MVAFQQANWRRGWESNPARLLETRKLLISLPDKNARNAGSASLCTILYKNRLLPEECNCESSFVQGLRAQATSPPQSKPSR